MKEARTRRWSILAVALVCLTVPVLAADPPPLPVVVVWTIDLAHGEVRAHPRPVR